MKLHSAIVLFLLQISINPLWSQNKTIDSLKLVIKTSKNDTTLCKSYNFWAERVYPFNPDSAKILWLKAKEIAEKNQKDKKVSAFYVRIIPYLINNLGSIYTDVSDYEKGLQYYSNALQLFLKNGDKTGAAEAYNNIGYVYEIQNKLDLATKNYEESLKYRKEVNDKKGMATTLNNIAYLAGQLGDQVKALNLHSQSLKIREEINDKEGIGHSLSNIASIYYDQGEDKKAMEYHLRALKVRSEVKSVSGEAISLMHIGAIYGDEKNYQKAEEYFKRSYEKSVEIDNKYFMGHVLNLLGNLHRNKGDHESSFEYYNQALKLYEEINNIEGLIATFFNLGKYYNQKKDYNNALRYYLKSMELSKERSYPRNIKRAAELLYGVYKAQNKPKQALEMYELFVFWKDSLLNNDTKKATLKNQYQNEYQKREIEIKALAKAEKEKIELQAAEQKKRQNVIIYSVALGFIIVSIFSFFIYRGLQRNKKANKIITLQKHEVESQKHIIEEKHKEITDSINYAERIQRSFLATKEHLNANLNEYFILFKPKDVVSGDFYWSATLNNGLFALVTADSTGHGVPGAIMSLLNIGGVEKAVESYTSPADILNSTRKTIIERLKKDGSLEGGKDGMDASLCVYDFKNKKLTIAAANNPVWIMRGTEVIEIKPEKMPIGKGERDAVLFTQQEIDLQKGDVVYTLTDGFPDQFGGALGKKFMSKKLRELLAKNVHLPMQEQKALLEKTFAEWVGNLEQVDDVTLIGVRV